MTILFHDYETGFTIEADVLRGMGPHGECEAEVVSLTLDGDEYDGPERGRLEQIAVDRWFEQQNAYGIFTPDWRTA